MKHYLLILFLIIGIYPAIAQSPIQNLKKYWYYRFRLQNDFLKVGPNQGESIPAEARFYGNNTIKWADAGMYIGWYLGVLATEYKLLYDNNQSTLAVTQELYYALLALERLDLNAELIYTDDNGNPGSPTLNGFFIRDDIPANFLAINDNLAHFNQGLTSPLSIIDVDSDYKSEIINGDGIAEMSQDQVAHIFNGLALVSVCVDAGVVINNVQLRLFAIDITNRIIAWVRTDGWRIKNPVTGNNVRRGHDARPWAFGIAAAATKITGTIQQNFQSISLEALWQIQQHFPNPNRFNSHLIASFVSDSWRLKLGPIKINSTRAGIRLVTYVPSEWDWRGFYLMHNSVLHGKNKNDHSTVEVDLYSAPCVGPYFFDSNDIAGAGWGSVHKYLKGFDELYDGGGDGGAEYNGLDYMLLHNLYYLSRLAKNGKDNSGNILPSYFNYMDHHEHLEYPRNFPPQLGSKSFPVTLEAFSSITSHSQLLSGGTSSTDADITYRSGVEIGLLPSSGKFIFNFNTLQLELEKGFSVAAGAEFGAFIDPFECIGPTYQKTGDSTITSGTYGMTNSMPLGNDHVPISPENIDDPQDITSPIYNDTNKLKNIEIFNVYPNPSSGVFTLSLKTENEQSDVYVIDILGIVIYRSQLTGTGEQEINLSMHPHGIYFVKVVSGDNMVIKKIVNQ